MFVDEPDGVTMTPKTEHAVQRPSRVLEYNQNMAVTQSEELVEWILADTVAIAPRPARVQLLQP